MYLCVCICMYVNFWIIWPIKTRLPVFYQVSRNLDFLKISTILKVFKISWTDYEFLRNLVKTLKNILKNIFLKIISWFIKRLIKKPNLLYSTKTSSYKLHQNLLPFMFCYSKELYATIWFSRYFQFNLDKFKPILKL